jgi:hypothetical protein
MAPERRTTPQVVLPLSSLPRDVSDELRTDSYGSRRLGWHVSNACNEIFSINQWRHFPFGPKIAKMFDMDYADPIPCCTAAMKIRSRRGGLNWREAHAQIRQMR